MTRFIRPARIAKSNENQQGVTDGGGAMIPKKARLGARPFPGLLMSADLARSADNAVYPFASGTATNLIASAVFTCIRTLCLPLASAARSADRTSAVLETALPPTLRMMSPV